MKKRVFCAMSGGLDSSVSAAILKKAGFEVIGVFMKLWFWPKKDKFEAKAKRIAKILKIPFYIFDFSREFKKKIVDYFLEGYKNGITPNPCVVCNKEIKFGLLLEKMLSFNTDFFATGHHAKIITDSKSKIKKLLRAKDKKRDQSYFLWMLNQEQLKKILFPIGGFKREEVEYLAKKFKLPVSTGNKSVELCFIKTKTNDFLKKHLGEKPGKIINKEGKILGEHRGLWFFTIGQRKNIGLSGGPYFVLNKDLKNNHLIVTKNQKDLFKNELLVKRVNWISGREPKLPLKTKVKIRYRANFASAIISKFSKDIYKIRFQKPQRAITPGQSAVFYQGEELMGGGIIS